MNTAGPSDRAAHPLLWTFAAIIVIAVLVCAYLVFGSNATDLAQDPRMVSTPASSSKVTIVKWRPSGIYREGAASPV